MKNFIFPLLIFSFLISGNIFSQIENYTNPFTQLSGANNNIPLHNGNAGLISAQCVSGIVYDDNTFENAYGWNAGYGIGKFVMKITPAEYPFTINQVCFALTRLAAGSANWTFDIVVYDATGTGGAPGTLITTIANQTAANVSVWPAVSWYDFTGLTTIPQLTSGSYYIGLSWDPATMGSHYIASDESATTPLQLCYGYIQSTWGLVSVNFPLVRALGIRVDGVGIIYAHNIAVGPFLSMPSLINTGSSYPIKAKVRNAGTTNETAIPMKFFVNGVLASTKTIPILNAGAVDSVNFPWTPAIEGDYVLKIVSALATDEKRTNDTVALNKHVYPAGSFHSCTGNGTTSVQYPFYTYYTDSRTDMLYLASELGEPRSILNAGYNFLIASPQIMNALKIKMQNTNINSISGFTNTGWTTVFDGTWSVPWTGLQYITFQDPFYYTGGNLLVEICFNNAGYTSSSTVTSTAATGRCYHAHQDLASGDGCVDLTSGAMQSTIPNMCFIGTLIEVQNTNSKVPEEFSLSQNYPNPFNPITKIKFDVPSVGQRHAFDVLLKIYDIMGREVSILVNTVLMSGTYEVEWDGTDYPSGLYFYKLECGDFSEVKKMVLIK